MTEIICPHCGMHAGWSSEPVTAPAVERDRNALYAKLEIILCELAGEITALHAKLARAKGVLERIRDYKAYDALTFIKKLARATLEELQ